MSEQDRIDELMRQSRHCYEDAWKRNFGKRLTLLMERAAVTSAEAALLAECSEERMRSIMRGEEFPTIPEVMRLCLLTYRAKEFLLEDRDG